MSISLPDFSMLNPLGWHPFFEAYARESSTSSIEDSTDSAVIQTRTPARVSAVFQGLYRVVSVHPETHTIQESLTELTGHFRHHAESALDFPTVGDWVLLEAGGRICQLLPRRGLLRRTQAGTRGQSQLIAANLDTLLILTSLNEDFNPRRLERYLTLAWESQAKPVIVINKVDLSQQEHLNPPQAVETKASETLEHARAALADIAMGTPILAISARYGEGLAQLNPWLKAGETLALVGSSGVGKSTLLNALMPEAVMDTGEIRHDDSKGKHTTTHRELFMLPQGALLIDTPGMRELRLADSESDLERTFQDIEALAKNCRFRNCQHTDDVGCAVQEAIARQELSEKRLASYQKQARELDYLQTRESESETFRAKRRWKQMSQKIRKQKKESYTERY